VRPIRQPKLVQHALATESLIAVAQVVLNGKEETVLLRASGRLIAMTTVNYADEVTEPKSYEGELTKAEWSATEEKMTRQLLDSMKQKRFTIGAYHDHYAERLQELVEAKVQGKQLVTPPATKGTPKVINLMDALRQSLKKSGGEEPRAVKSATKRGKAPAGRSASRKKSA
jgi:DNA end-binding protein Ku